MVVTWDEFLQLATIVTNLHDAIYYFNDEKIEIELKNRRVTAAALEYEEFFNDLKYVHFMNEVRISFAKNLLPFLFIINNN